MTQTAIPTTLEITMPLRLVLEWCSCCLLMGALGLLQFGRRLNRREIRPEPQDDVLLLRSKTLEALLREVNHRVKNNFTSLIGLLQMKQDFAQAPQEVDRLKEIETTLSGLAQSHHMLSLNDWSPINLEALCRSLIHSTVTLTGTPFHLRIDASPPDLKVRHAQTHPLSLIVNELASNAVKHAVLPGTPLVISMTLREKNASIHLCFKDNGPGYPSFILNPCPQMATMGLQIIRDLTTSSLGGTLALSNESGAMTCATFPK